MPISQILLTSSSGTPTPTYTLTPAANNVNEGASLTFTVGGSNIVDGTYYWIASNANTSDLEAVSGSVTVTNNYGTFSVTAIADTNTEGAESFDVWLRPASNGGTILATSTITINDTSLTPTPTYTLTALGSQASATSVDEGSAATFEAGGTNIPDGTYYWTIESNNEEFATASGSFSITGNTGQFIVTPTADDTTEGEQTFTVSIRSVSVTGTVLATSDPFTINDTSLDPITYEVTPAANNVDEGSSLEFTVSGTNIPDDTYYWTIETGSSEFATTSGEFTITSNAGSFTVTPTADESTEGADTFTLVIRSGSITGTELIFPTSPVTINDTSLTPATYTLTPAADNVDEGSSLEFTVGGTNIPDGNYSWVIENDSGDFTTTFGTVTVTSNSGTFSVTPDADDTTEGPGSFTVSLRIGLLEPNLVTSDSVTINDTSLDLTPTYQIAPRANNVNEGSSLIIDVSGTNIPDDTYFWTVETLASDFGTSSGEVEITNNAGSFTVTPDVDATTEGSETFTVSLRSVSITGTVLATTDNDITINDTSLDPEPPFSLMFNTPQQDFLRVPANSDWNLGNNWTIEFWLKANNSSNAGINIPGGQWGLLNQGGWYYGMANDNCILVGLAGGNLTINQSANDDIQFAEPTAQVWTHVAIVNDGGGSAQKVYYNGREQTKVSGSYTTNGKTNTSDDLYIGRLAPNYASYFDGKMAMVRISNTAKYAAAFTSTVTYGVESDTRLFLDSDTPLTDLSLYELNGLTTSANALGTIYFSKATYPNLNNQVRSGDTVVKVSDSTTSTVTGAVFTADPSNWGVPVSPGWAAVGTVNFSGPGRHTIVNNGTTVSEEFPNTFTGLVHPYGGGTFGATYCLADNPGLAEATAIPIGARITSNIAGFGTRTVTGNQSDGDGGRIITYDNTGLTGNTSTSHVFNFYW